MTRDASQLSCIAPASGRLLATVPIASPEEVQQAVARSRALQEDWGQRSIQDRTRVVMRFRDLLMDRGTELAQLLSTECGKPEIEAYMAEVFALVDLVTWYARRARRILKKERIWLHLMLHRRSTLHFEPLGVIGIISPWNFPLVIPVGEIVLALLAGNGCVVKPSEETPLIALKALELLEEAGVPKGLVSVVTGRGETGAAVIEAGVDKVVFTGSVATGRRVAVACAERLVPCTLELGGKAPAVVLPGASLERTARALVWGAFVNSGQVCASVERVFVHRSQHDALLTRIVDLTRKLRQGDPETGEVDVGAIIHRPQIQVAQRQVADAVKNGAQVETGGKTPEGPGAFFEPTVLSGVLPEMAVMREETFAPLLPICVYDNVDQAIEWANDSHLGLMAYVFSRSQSQGEAVARRIVAGTVMVNDVLNTYAMPETPWAGLKDSGLGRVHTAEALRGMCQVRHINRPATPTLHRELWWYPYRPATYRWMRRLVQLLFGRGLGRLRLPPSPPRGPVLPHGATSAKGSVIPSTM